ncbi:H-NS histone family protein [Jannaschia donghaensis]|nr:H-NS histone family protein [Jannaschia donghaensis]
MPVKPKYRHPENEAMTWSGRGRQSASFKDAMEAGNKPESMLIGDL